MTPEVRAAVRKLRTRLCAEAEGYKGVRPENCRTCASPCCYGMQLLDVLGMPKPEKETDRKDGLCQYSAMINAALPTNPYLLAQVSNAQKQETPKSGRKVWRDMGDCWIVIAFESGPLKLLEIECKEWQR